MFKIIIFPIIIILLYLVGARAVAIIAYTLYIILFSINKNDYEHIKVVKIIYIISVILFIIYVLWIFDIIPSLITLFEDIFDYIASLFK